MERWTRVPARAKGGEIETVIRCFSCRALVPDIEGPTHRYMTTAPGCWKLYGDLLAREFSDYFDRDIHGLTVDTYAVTHPGEPQRVAIQSVDAHLLRIYFRLEKGWSGERAPAFMKKIVENDELKEQFTWLEPPLSEDVMNVTDVLTARDFEEHKALVNAWARSVWDVWKDKHLESIEMLADKVFSD